MRASTYLALTGLTLTSLILASSVMAQGMGDGMGQGMGGGGGRGGGRHRGKRGQGEQAPAQDSPGIARPAPTVVSVATRLQGVVSVAGETKAFKATSIPSDKPDMSGLYALRNAQVTLDTVTITTSGAATLVDNTREYGMNSALLIDSGASVTLLGGRIDTRGQGATAAYVHDDGASLRATGANLTTAGSGAYGIEIRPGGSFEATDISVATQSDHAIALSIEAHGPPVRLTGGRFTTAGPLSPTFLLSRPLEASGVSVEARRAEAVVITGSHPIHFTDSHLSGDYAVMLYRPAEPGDASEHDGQPDGGQFGGRQPKDDRPGWRQQGERGQMDGHHGRARAANGGADQAASVRPVTDMMATAEQVRDGLSLKGGTANGRRAVFYVTNMHAHIALDTVELRSTSGVILRAAADQWGELGRNGGDATLDARHQTLTGDFVTDAISHIAVNLNDDSHFTGIATHNTDMTLDATSTWTLTADSAVGTLNGDRSRIDSQGHTLHYDTSRNPSLNGATYTLPGGGQLVPGL
ncbi:hypothetical protein AEAC466_01400 [Asticcacaulis sp. AC466]|uniref:hypothetical protein n=1 Tax=Asticcacaulis sp. AC466 TaxID=1282362 RepID=UPI0003C3EB1C|nr:hypothetical protein [Asticcacaulis sp. AC466]ESQ85861.1 hypothetical protein AEAC466_01400 [Asticcacaulis sp. AC466]